MMRLRRGKWRASGSVPGGNSATTAPLLAERVVEAAVLLGIDDVDAARARRRPALVERAQMRRRVDPARQARDDDDARFAERGRQLAREAAAVGRGVARADHRDDRRPQQSARPSTVSTGGASSTAASAGG